MNSPAFSLAARERGATGLPTVRVYGPDSPACMRYIDAHGLEFALPPLAPDYQIVQAPGTPAGSVPPCPVAAPAPTSRRYPTTQVDWRPTGPGGRIGENE